MTAAKFERQPLREAYRVGMEADMREWWSREW